MLHGNFSMDKPAGCLRALRYIRSCCSDYIHSGECRCAGAIHGEPCWRLIEGQRREHTLIIGFRTKSSMFVRLRHTLDPGISTTRNSQLPLACLLGIYACLRAFAESDSGRYVIPALLARNITALAVSVPALRAFNGVMLLYLPKLVANLLDLVRSKNSQYSIDRVHHLREALCICTFPLVFFFGFLYYTDVASLLLVLLTYRQALRKSYTTSALVQQHPSQTYGSSRANERIYRRLD